MNDTHITRVLSEDETLFFEKTKTLGVFGMMVNIKKLKTRPTRTLEIEIDPYYGPTVIEMSEGDIPAENTNEVSVAVVLWDDFVTLCKAALGDK